MTNRERYGTGPQDVDLVRREMMARLVGKHQTDEIVKFFYEKVRPAHWDFLDRFREIVEATSDHFSLSAPSDFLIQYGQVNKLDANDYYNAMKSGVEVTDNERFFFYYYVYAMSAPYPPWEDYTMLIKSDGKYRIINDLDTCSKDALFEDVKRSFLEAEAQLEN